MRHIDIRGKVHVVSIGKENTPVIVIDDFSPEPQRCIGLAIQKTFSKELTNGVYYPGIRALVDDEYGNSVLQTIADLVRTVYKIAHPNTLIPHAGYYSLINKAENELDFLQTLPHFDSTETHYYAVMHYLNPGVFGGTGFYRHNPTGYENITRSRADRYIKSAQEVIDKQETVEFKYFTQSTAHYELIDKLEYKQNRLVIYPGSLLHSGYIDNCERDLSSDPKTGRLTANLFIDFR
ncbi:DUF6445 family protein [Paraglaciecola sp. L3A3]|uniref:DUF6445 family protein n=1 Tax=Paraglaciecola sp. L3A3 TaxID=2686358 RepID=UPI00131CDCAC|nr:DUF6445 family protein [Paraglaciecola sp. L3A3]